MPDVPQEPTIVVCDSCLMRSCWDYIFLCDNHKTAGLTKKTEAELRSLGREHEDYFMPAFEALKKGDQ